MGQCGTAYALIFSPGYFVHQYDLHYEDIIRPAWVSFIAQEASGNVINDRLHRSPFIETKTNEKQLFLVFGNFYTLVLPAIKTAILLDWCRIFVVGNRTTNTFWLACMAVAALQWAWGIACFFLLNFQCTPHSKIWAFYLPGNCISLHTIQLCSASVQLFSDLIMTFLPHKVVWILHMTWRKRLGLSFVFGCGAL